MKSFCRLKRMVRVSLLSLSVFGCVPEGADSPALDSSPSAAQLPSQVVGRYVFYDGSSFDDAQGVDSSDDRAIATDKAALLPGGTATGQNYTNFSKGITGVMIDLTSITHPERIDAQSFDFRVRTEESPFRWAEAPAPEDVVVRPGAGTDGSDRVTIVWPEGAIVGTWLRVRVKTSADGSGTGLCQYDTFYFGNLPGESGGAEADAAVAMDDLGLVLDALGSPSHDVNSPLDYDRDGSVTLSDLATALGHLGERLNLLQAPSATSTLVDGTPGSHACEAGFPSGFVTVPGPHIYEAKTETGFRYPFRVLSDLAATAVFNHAYQMAMRAADLSPYLATPLWSDACDVLQYDHAKAKHIQATRAAVSKTVRFVDQTMVDYGVVGLRALSTTPLFREVSPLGQFSPVIVSLVNERWLALTNHPTPDSEIVHGVFGEVEVNLLETEKTSVVIYGEEHARSELMFTLHGVEVRAPDVVEYLLTLGPQLLSTTATMAEEAAADVSESTMLDEIRWHTMRDEACKR